MFCKRTRSVCRFVINCKAVEVACVVLDVAHVFAVLDKLPEIVGSLKQTERLSGEVVI